jgi:Raf kinase inhibitor-like YbhB/YbcL family protein
MYLENSAYRDGETMPARFATRQVEGGTGASVPLLWGDEPKGTRSYVIEMIDHHPVAHEWLHWLAVDIPGAAHEVPEGASTTPAMPAGARELPNRAGRTGYGGPQPPVGSGVHDYEVTVFALDVPHLGVGPDSTLQHVASAMAGHVLGRASLVGRFGR